MKKKRWYSAALAAALLLAAIYVFFPRPASDLVITISFWEISQSRSGCSLYYTTDTQPEYSDEQRVSGDIDYNKMQVSFRLDGALEDHLTGLRLDFPEKKQQFYIKSVMVSSAGVPQKDYNPCIFFDEENIIARNDLDFSTLDASNSVYVSTGKTDPYLVFSDSLVKQVENCFSHQTGSRMLVCVFLVAVFVIARRGIFTDDTAVISAPS